MRAIALLLLLLSFNLQAESGAWVQTPYANQKVLFDFYFDEPAKINSALYWIRSQRNPLMDEPYNQSPDFMKTVVIIHGTEIVTVASKNYDRYKVPIPQQ